MSNSAARLPTRQINTITSHTGPINTIAFSNLGGTYILTGSSDRSIHLSRTEPGSASSGTKSNAGTVEAPPSSPPIQKYTSHGYPVLSLTVSSQNTHFASSGGDRSVFYWDIQTPNSTLRRFGANTSQSHTSRITCVSFGGESDSVLVSGSDDRSVRLWDCKSRDSRPLMVLEDAKDGISGLCVRGSEIVSGSVDGRVRSYDLRMGTCTVDVQPGPVGSVELTRDGRCVLVSCLDGKIRLMDRGNGGLLKMFPEQSIVTGYKNESLRIQSCLGVGEALVVSGSEGDGRVRAWDILTGKMVDDVLVSENDKVVSVVKWREGSKSQGRHHVWAAGGADGIIRIYSL